MEKYLSLKGLNIDDFRVKGQFLPFGDYRVNPGRKNILLCGDAAGTVDPITGEGIAYAMQSGHWAAQAILQQKIYRGLIKPSNFIKTNIKK